MIRLRGVALALALVAGPAAPPAFPAPFAGARCYRVAVSPAFATDGKLACVGINQGLLLSTDRGRSWQHRTPPAVRGSVDWMDVLFSPRYAVDRKLYVFTSHHVLVSVDDGATFVPLDGQITELGTWPLGVFVAAGPGPLPERVSFASPNLNPYTGPRPEVIEPDLRLRRPVTGSRPYTLKFATPARMGPGDVAFSLAARAGRIVVDRCDAAFTCATEVLRVTLRGEALGSLDLWLSPDWPRRRAVHLVLPAVDGARAYRSLDGGASFQRWRGVERLAAPQHRAHQGADVSFARHAALPNVLYAAVEYDLRLWSPQRVLQSVLYRSDDAGTTWRRVADAYRGDHGVVGRAGRLPAPFGRYGTALTLAADGRLFATVDAADQAVDTYCSVDGGRSWRALCPR